MELFTGAQCPPCVAADVAFDALLKTYKPSELVTLQYHLHIPGPDPLTNGDSETRQRYYGDSFHGTPSTYFNGDSKASGGGGMGNAKDKYDEYRKVIDAALKGKRRATIDLKVNREGDEIKILAMAQATSTAKEAKSKDQCAPEADDEAPDASKLRLRLALVEEEIRYVGSNKLRFHHHVVRGMPGGAKGQALSEGQGKVDLTLTLDDVRKGLEDYLAPRKARFPNPLPPIALEHLSVVAFVQDDDSKEVLHAVMVPVDKK
jgi:hypothetical protein